MYGATSLYLNEIIRVYVMLLQEIEYGTAVKDGDMLFWVAQAAGLSTNNIFVKCGLKLQVLNIVCIPCKDDA